MISTTVADEVKRGNSVTYFTVGVSMRPLLTERKTHVTIVPLTDAKNGDILLYLRRDGSQVLHRLIKQDKDFYYMRGDNTYGLEPIKREAAVGVVTHIYRKGKTFGVKECGAYRAYTVLWRMLYPFRYFTFKLRAILSKIKSVILRRSK